MNKAVFLDRDGTLISYRLQGLSPYNVRLLPGAAAGIRLLDKAGFKLIVITNQPSVARGLISLGDLDKVHADLERRLTRFGAKLDAVYACPHEHADGCVCRKPQSGMVEEAIKEFNIDPKKSFFVGDSTRDIETGLRARIKTILVLTGEGGRDKRFYDPKPDWKARNLLDAAKIILANEQD